MTATVQDQSKFRFPLFSILTIIFVIAKLDGAIDWSWWIIFAPTWLPILVSVGVLLLAIFVVALAEAVA